MADQVDHRVDRVDAAAAHAPGRALRRIGPPHAFAVAEASGAGGVAFQVKDGPEGAVVDQALHLVERRQEPAVMTGGEHNVRLLSRLHRLDRTFAGDRHRLVDEDVLLGLGRKQDLLGMDGMRGRQNDGVDLGVGQGRLVVGVEREAVVRGEGRGMPGRAGDTAHETDLVAFPLDRVHQGLPPAPQPYDRAPDHTTSPRREPARLQDRART